tara:strand:+ start:16954 stop:18207 length:1254 start_codon:yes stop_codon:yes gene_type:complete
MWYAIDFGTSNSLLSYIEDGQAPRLINLDKNGPILRSLIFTPEKNKFYFGSEAIDKYQDSAGDGRFFRSLKKFLPEPGFKGTEVFGERMKIEDLIATILRDMKTKADQQVGKNVENVVLGRPALYSLDLKNDQLAEDRMRRAAELVGFKRIEFCPEPIAAGLNVEADGLSKNVLVCDFGGGTSDFTLLKTGTERFTKENVLGLSGVFVAGDAIDGRVMRDFISAHFGKNITYKAPMGSNVLRFPKILLTKLCNPAHIAFLKERDTWEQLKELELWSVGDEDQRYFNQLFALIEEQLGYPVYAQIEKSKIELGEKSSTFYQFKNSSIDIDQPIHRSEFENAIEPELENIFESLEKVFAQSELSHKDIDEVRITGGTGQMPLVQKKLVSLFGEEKIIRNDAFQSVVQGLGLYAQSLIGT